MREKILFLLVGIMTLAALGVFSSTLVHATLYAPDESVEIGRGETAATAGVLYEYPSRLIIPTLLIDAHIQRVGIAASGNMAVPSNYTDVAWYRAGTLPGEKGSAVINGHVDNGFGLPGVFKHLSELEAGDNLYVETNTGKRLLFVVERIVLYPYDSAPRDLLFERADTNRLNLITCDGAWIAGQKTYDHRLVIYTKLVTSE